MPQRTCAQPTTLRARVAGHALEDDLVLAVAREILVGQADDVHHQHTVVDGRLGANDGAAGLKPAVFGEQGLGLHRRLRVVGVGTHRGTWCIHMDPPTPTHPHRHPQVCPHARIPTHTYPYTHARIHVSTHVHR